MISGKTCGHMAPLSKYMCNTKTCQTLVFVTFYLSSQQVKTGRPSTGNRMCLLQNPRGWGGGGALGSLKSWEPSLVDCAVEDSLMNGKGRLWADSNHHHLIVGDLTPYPPQNLNMIHTHFPYMELSSSPNSLISNHPLTTKHQSFIEEDLHSSGFHLRVQVKSQAFLIIVTIQSTLCCCTTSSRSLPYNPTPSTFQPSRSSSSLSDTPS